MAQPRTQLHDLLVAITDHVYFQPPADITMQYPCIVYQRDGSDSDYAENKLYRHHKRYQITVIDRNPDSALPDLVENLELCKCNQFFAVKDLNHWVFTLFF